MRYKAMPASVRFGSPQGDTGPPRRTGGVLESLRRWTASLLMLALIPAALLPIILAHAATAVLSVSPTTTMPGASMTVHGSAFVPRSHGAIHLDALSDTEVSYRADRLGGFVIAFKIPNTTAPGTHILFASSSGSGRVPASTLASVSFEVAAPGSSPPSESPLPAASPAASPSPTPVATPSGTVRPTISPIPSPTSIPSGGTSLRLPIRAAFYYPWFPEGWNQQGMNPFTHFHPSLGYYDGSSATVIKAQIAAMQYGNIKAGIASWWGIGTRTDQRIPALLRAASGTGFRWALYYEPEGEGNPSVARINTDLVYIATHYATDPSYLRINGRFVVFVYGDPNDSCAAADRWRLANPVDAFVVLKVFSGYRTCPSQPDGWHQYGPASATDAQPGYSFSISPGFFKASESAPRLVRDIDRWYGDVRLMIASGAPFQLITTFNEWGEGTSVESAVEWQTSPGYGAYLDALHRDGVP